MFTISDSLLRCPLFEGIASEELGGMLMCLGAKHAAYKKGDVILCEGSPAQDVGILISGQIQLMRTDYYGNRSILMNIQPGQLFGESFACSKAEVLPVTVLAAENCEILLLNCRRILSTCQNACVFHNRIIFNLLQIVADKNLALYRKTLITAKRSTREKLMTYLLLQAKASGRADFTIPFDRQGLADYLEVDRSGLSAEMSKLKKEGVLDYHKSHFRLLAVQDGLSDSSGGSHGVCLAD